MVQCLIKGDILSRIFFDKRMTKKLDDQGEWNPSKRKVESSSSPSSEAHKRGRIEDEDAVDYGEEPQSERAEVTANSEESGVTQSRPPMSTPGEDEKHRIMKALESWCTNNIAKDKDDPESDERVTALAEVGLLLVFEHEKYPNAESMRTELEDIGSIIGGEQVVTRYINFILSLQNQLKKTRMQAERHFRQQQQQHMMQQFPGHTGFQFPPHGMMPVMMHPGGPMFVPQQGMFLSTHGFPGQVPGPHGSQHAGHGNMTLNATGEMSEVQKRKEKERKRKEILAECTEHLKALLERATKTSDPPEKAKIYELIDKVKKRIDSLKEVPASQQMALPKQSTKGPIRGYFGNQYINPQLLEKPKSEQNDRADPSNPSHSI
jgi:hypothetical protein